MILVQQLVAGDGEVGVEVLPQAGGVARAQRRVALAARARQQLLRARVLQLRRRQPALALRD